MKRSMAWILVSLLAVSVSGCQSDDDKTAGSSAASAAAAAGASAAPSAASDDLAILSGPVPQCPELVAPDRRDYRVAAFRHCEHAITVTERMNSPGCHAAQKIGGCLAHGKAAAYSWEQYRAEKAAAVQ